MQSNNNDILNLSKQVRLTSQLSQKQKIVFSCEILKFNDANKGQIRIFMISNIAIYNIQKSQNFIKSMMSKLVNFNKKFTIRRKIHLQNIQAVTLSNCEGNSQLVIHIQNDYDYRMSIGDLQTKKILLKALCIQYEKVAKKKMGFYFKNDVTLVQYYTSKEDLKSKINRMPKQALTFLNVQDLADYQAPGVKFKLLYSENGQKLQISQFVSSSLQKMTKNRKYFSIQPKNTKYQNININFQNKHNFINLPQFVYSANQHLYLLRSFMIGGKMDKLVINLGSFKKQICAFYIAQLILALQFLHSNGWVYRAMSLSNIYIKQNGYIALDGMNKLMRKKKKIDQLFYDICGLPQDMAPQMILCEGYNQSIDIWGLGICAYNMLEGHHPFISYNVKETFRNILEKKIQEPQNLPNFISQCLLKNPQQRPSIQQIKKDACFANIDWPKLEKQQIISPYIPQLNSVLSWEGKLPCIMYLQNTK